MTKTDELLRLPKLPIAHDNFSSCFIGACNHRWAIYQVDVRAEPRRPFWVVELGYDDKPLNKGRRYSEYSTALDCIHALAAGMLRGRNIDLPVEE